MVNYQDSVIYTISVGDEKYVGSTTSYKRRKYQHKYCIVHPNEKDGNLPIYQAIRNNDEKWTMEIYKIFPCNNKKELEIEEERCRKEINASLNGKKCFGFDAKEWRENNKEKRKDDAKDYYLNNKERFKATKIKNNVTMKITCECGCVVTKGNISTHRKSKKHQELMN